MRKLTTVLLSAFLFVGIANADGLLDVVTKGSTDRSVTVDIIDSTDGTPETAVAFNTSGIDLWYRREGAALTSITEATLAALTTAHTDGGFLAIANGKYRLDLPDAAFASGANYVDIGGTVTGMIVIGGRVKLIDANLEVANLTANVMQFGGSNLTATGGRPEVNVSHFGGTAGTFASGRPEVNTSHWAGTAVASAVVQANMAQISGDATAADNLEARLDGTCGEYRELGIARGSCTAQAATSTTLQLDTSATFADDVPIGMTLVACGSTQGYCQSRVVSDYVGSTDTATVPQWQVTPSGTVIFYLIGTAPNTGAGATAAEVWAYSDRTLTALDEDNMTIDLNATTLGTVTTLTNLPAITSNWLTAAGINADAFTAAKFASDVTTELQSGLATASALTTVSGLVDDLETRMGTPSNLGSGATLAANNADIEGQTDDIGAAGAGLTAADDAVMTRLGSPSGASVVADIATRSSQTSVDDLPTNSELSTALAAADDPVLAAIAALNNLSTAQIRDMIIEDQGGGISMGCALAAILAERAGDVVTTGANSTYEDPSGTETRVSGSTTSPGNRTASVTCPSY